MLDPITMGDKKYASSVATEELKRFKTSVQEASVWARSSRSKMLDESLHKLNKYWEAVTVPSERLGGSHFSKMGSQTHRSPSELGNQRLEDRPKNVVLNKRIRTSVAETRAEALSNGFVRQPLAMGKDRDNIKDGGKGCDVVGEKIRRLPAGGETWDRKMKRKRSVGAVFGRSIDGEGELKKVMHLRLANESGLQSSDAQGLRSGYSGSNGKHDVASLPAGSNGCTTAKNEQEKVSRDSMDGSNKERVVLKGNRFGVRDNNYTGGHTVTKGKASRAPRTGAVMAGNSSSVSRLEVLEAEEQHSNVNKPHSLTGTNNRKRPLTAGSSHMAQWVGQRPQKICRTRRANVVSPVLSCDEVHTPVEGCSPSDVGTRLTSTISGKLISSGAVNSNIQFARVKHESVSSPTRLSESEESGAGENGESKLKEKGLESNEVDERAMNNSYNISSSVLATKKKKIPNKEETGDGLRRQGRGSRGSSVLKNSISPIKEKLESSNLIKLTKNVKPASEKNGGKSGRPPLKKSCDRKAIICLGHPSSNNSPDIAGESDDDREELLAAANFASNASYIGCSSSFWKRVESIFTPISLKDISYSKQLVKTTEADLRCLSQMLGLGSDDLDGLMHNDGPLSHLSLSRERRTVNDSKGMSSMVDMVDQHLDDSTLCRQMDSEGNKVAPLYQRVLTALIIDDQIEEETLADENSSFLCEKDDSPEVGCLSQDVESHSCIKTEYEFNSDKVSCNGNATFSSGTKIDDQELGVSLRVDQESLHPEAERLSILSENGGDELMSLNRISSSFSQHFEQMSVEDKLLLELQSVGLYLEPVPDLADGDCEAINQDILQLQKGLFQQLTKKREHFMKLIQAVEQGREIEQRSLQQVAIDKLVELAYKKKLATRGTSAARHGLSKVSRPVALAFMKRTLARCRKFEETGKSCFLEPVYKDVLFSSPARDDYTGSAVAVNLPFAQNSQQGSDKDFARTGPILNGGKKKELLLDDVGASPPLRSASNPGNSLVGGTKGKRSERDSSGRNFVAKGGRSSTGYPRGERKTKAKSKPKTAQLSSSGNGYTNSEHQLVCGSNGFINSDSNRKSKVGSVSQVHDANDLSLGTEEPMAFTNLHELDPIELCVANELNGHQDLESWLNIDDDGSQDDALCLDIPMDDLSGLNMLPIPTNIDWNL